MMVLPSTPGARPVKQGRLAVGKTSKIASTPNQLGVLLDAPAIEAALAEFQITDPVQISWAQGMRLRGRHRYREGVHVITLGAWRSAEQVSVTLWHELVHARQRREIGEEWGHEYTEETRRQMRRLPRQQGRSHKAYMANCYEVEARAVSAELAVVKPLAYLP